MATQVQTRRGSTAEHSTFTGAVGELTVDTTKDTVVVHDGSTAGGAPLLREDGSNSALALGSAATPSLKFTGDPNTGIYSPGADQLALSTNGTQRISIGSDGDINIDSGGVFYDASTNRLAIGSTSPGRTLDVAGTIRSTTGVVELDNATQFKLLSFHQSGTRTGIVSYDNTNNWIYINAEAASSQMLFGTAGIERCRLDSSGRLLVGTSTARATRLGTTTITPIAQTLDQGSGGFFVYNNVAGANPATIYAAKSRGNDYTSAVQSGDNLFKISAAGADGTQATEAAAISIAVDGTPGANDMPGRLVFSTTADGASSPTERMRIDRDGRAYMYAVNSADVVYSRSDAAAGSSISLFTGWHSVSSIVSGGTLSFNVTTNGNVTNTNNSYGAISDIKLKENIVDAGSQWNDLKALQVRNYNFKAETGQQTHTQLGLIAQEVELVSPGLVTESPDRDEEGNNLGTVTKSVNYSVLYMKAVKALQEAMERIETLEAKVAALESA